MAENFGLKQLRASESSKVWSRDLESVVRTKKLGVKRKIHVLR